MFFHLLPHYLLSCLFLSAHPYFSQFLFSRPDFSSVFYFGLCSPVVSLQLSTPSTCSFLTLPPLFSWLICSSPCHCLLTSLLTPPLTSLVERDPFPLITSTSHSSSPLQSHLLFFPSSTLSLCVSSLFLIVMKICFFNWFRAYQSFYIWRTIGSEKVSGVRAGQDVFISVSFYFFIQREKSLYLCHIKAEAVLTFHHLRLKYAVFGLLK